MITDWAKEHVVVTGGAGFIGSHLVEELILRGARVTVLDDLRRGHAENLALAEQMATHGHLQCFTVDLGQQLFTMRGCVVFHLAARVTNIAANQQDHLGMLQDNLMVNAKLFDSIRDPWNRPKLLVLASTVCVYPHDAPVPTPEDAGWPLHPEDTNEGYGLAKGLLEAQGRYLHREYGVPVVIVRFSNAFGPRDYYDWESSHVVPALIRKVLEGQEPLEIWGSGNQTRVFVDARDLATALVKLAETPKAADAQPINIGHHDEISIRDLAEMVAKACGKPEIEMVFDTSKPDGHLRRAVDSTRLHSLIDWEPRPLVETIEDMVAEFTGGESWL